MTIRKDTQRRIWRLAGAAFLVSLTVTAQEQPTSVYFEQVEVNVVNIEVFVTDADGRRVEGLTRDDFEIYQDGEQVEITNFFAVDREDRIMRSVEAGTLPDGAPPTPEPRLLPAEHRLNLLVYFDDFNLQPGNRARIVDQVGDFMTDRIAQGDNVMLVSSFRSPQVVVPLTRDPQAIADGLRKLKKGATHRQVDEAQLRQAMKSMEIAFAEGKPREAHGWVRTYIQSATADLRVSSGAVTDMVRSLAGLPGRKAIIYVSEGLPQRPGEELYQYLADLFGESGLDGARAGGYFVDPSIESISEDQTDLFNVIAREANANQVTFYTLDATGGKISSGISSELRTDVSIAGGQTTLAAMRVSNLQQPLIDMAEATGGASVLNTFNFDEALVRVATDFDSFYSLGYAPNSSGDGKFHNIEVRVKHPALRVRHRTGYLDKPPAERVGDRTVASLVFGLEKNPLEIEVDFGDAQRVKKGKYHLPVMVRIPIREVTRVPGDSHEEGRLEIYMAVRDEDGISDLERQSYPVQIPNELISQAQDKDIGYSVTLLVRPGEPTVGVGVWDAISGLESFVLKQVLVAKER
jgi:VWFA-related protein